MSYVEKNLASGEKLLYQTRHHWVVLLGPILISVLLAGPAAALLLWSFGKKRDSGYWTTGTEAAAILGALMVLAAIGTFAYGIAKRNATEMAVTNRRVLIKTGMVSRRTLDLMLTRVESIGVEETGFSRMLGYGLVVVRGTGGTPEPFDKIAHPQEFRRAVQEQIGSQ
jgi:uncharacterized membrane protein YdbT with pleckstrin-like domain